MRSRLVAGLACMALLTPAVLAAPKCTTGELFAGSPDYPDPADQPEDGQGLLDVPPVGFRSLVFVGDKLVTATGAELWFTDLAEKTPVLTHFTGRYGVSGHQSIGGKCRTARFGNISGIAALPDGSIAGTDQAANNVFIVTDPFGPDCAVTLIAGATKDQPSLNPGSPDAIGDTDGPGTGALLSGPDWPAVLPDGAIYFLDNGVSKVKRVLPDAAHTVETVATLPEGNYFDMIAMNGKLYTVANNSASEGVLTEIDPKTGELYEVVRGRSDIWQSDGAINLSGLASDGKGLITTQSGQVLYVTLKGDVRNIAGDGTYFELKDDYDPHVPHSAYELQLWSSRRTMTAGANVFLAYKDGQIYFSAMGTAPYVERITCK